MLSLSPQEVAELKARHLAFSNLIKGCQDATIRLRGDRAYRLSADNPESTEYKAVEILEEILNSWCDTLSILRANLNQSSPIDADASQRPVLWRTVFTEQTATERGQSVERRGT